MHFDFTKPEFPIKGKDMVRWANRSHVRKASWRELRCAGVPSEIESQGFMDVVTHDLVKADFPMD
jgi:hypothetical protein